MKLNPELIINGITSFAYSWIPALLILWFLIARKPKAKVWGPLLGFVVGVVLSTLAGHINRFTSLRLFPGPETFQFFFTVGLVEELIKFASSILGILLVSFKDWRRHFQGNWLAQAMSGALGFAAAENFIYGIDGQGGIARVIPLVAHTCFAIFWGYGIYKASYEKNPWKSAGWITLGLFEGILLHGIYDCIVSENIVSNYVKIISWILLGVLIWALIKWHQKIVERYKAQENQELGEQQALMQVQQESRKLSLPWVFASVLAPGAGHILYRKEIFNGLTFLTLSFFLPYVILRFSLNEVIAKLAVSQASDDKVLQEFAYIILFCLIAYLGVGIWSAWELTQAAKDLDRADSKRRLTAFFPVSTLFFVSLLTSFFLPALDKPKGKKDGEDKSMVIKEIPLGITWEIEKVPPAPQQEKDTEVGTTEAINSITIDSNPRKKPDTKNKKKQPDPAKDKPPSGVQNSDSLDRENLPDKLPQIGYIGVQLSEMVLNQEIRPYIAFVYPGTSADRAGLRSGDYILSVNGKSSAGLNAFQVSNMVRGPLGTAVELVVYRPDSGEVKVKAFRTGTVFANDNNLPLDPKIR
jgi:RsiW-degrading membrane proteinase PrsW (M82 family)